VRPRRVDRATTVDVADRPRLWCWSHAQDRVLAAAVETAGSWTRGTRRPFDGSPFSARQIGGPALAAVIGIAYGLYDAWHGGGDRGPFGWGPGSLG
jgi:hypothetical protein